MHQGSDIDPNKELSKKRTFDLALFSSSQIILIEAKAHQGFTSKEVESFSNDKTSIQDCTEVSAVHTAAIVSSKYSPRSSTLKDFSLTPLLRWKDLAKLYEQSTRIFLRADQIYND